MRCLKVDEYIKRTACLKETCLLHEDLETYVKSGPGPQGRTICDRVIRACNQQLGVGALDRDHTTCLIKLVELALHGYDVSGELGSQSSPLYMEKIIFHILKKLATLGVHPPCSHLGNLLHKRLVPIPQTEDYCVLVRSCFAVLWNALSGSQDKTSLSPRDKLHYQMQALSFLLLLDRDKTSSPACSKAPMYIEDALTEFEKGSGTLTGQDASFLLKEMLTYLAGYWTMGCIGEGDGEPLRQPCLPTVSEVVLMTSKLLCKAGYWALASGLVDEVQGRDCSSYPYPAMVLGRWAVDIQRSLSSGGECGQAFTECARTLRSLPAALGVREGHAVLEGCSMVVWAVEAGQGKGLSGPVLLAWFSCLEEHQELMIKRLQREDASQSEKNRLQQSLCFSMYQGFVFTYDSMLASQLENTVILDRVLLYCQATAGRMMTEIRKLPNDGIFVKAVTAVSNLVCGLYNRQLYNQAFTLVEILCQELCKNCPESLSIDRVNRPFMLAVQSSRRGGHLERALDWVIIWLQVLGERVTEHMTEPVALWVKTKADAARAGQEDTRLRTLRDGFGPDVPAEGVMLGLLEEELKAYRESAGDTTQERYNTLCDLLDICHEESTHTQLRAVYLCDMAQVVCFQDFSEQTDCSAVDFTHESLRLLEEEPETVENADRLKDDRAHASLWLYICTLEKNLQEAMEKGGKLRDVCEQAGSDTIPVATNDLDYEDKQKQQDSHLVYEGLHFNLADESKRHQPLDRALAEWASLLQNQKVPSVRNPIQTCSSIGLTAALYKLLGKPLQALEAYQLAIGLSRGLGDTQGCATSLCHSARLLLELGAPELGESQLEQAEHCLGPNPSTEGASPLSVMATLLRAQLCYSTGQVKRGVSYLCEVLREVGEQRHSKSWYLLRARALQTCSAYLSLDTGTLPEALRQHITDHGLKSPDVVLYDSLKLLCSLLVTLVGNGLYGAYSSSMENHFIDQGDNLVLKWQLLSELLACSVRMVYVRSSSGAVHEAKLQCLEALKLATKLQALSQCAELLVVKAELELMKGEREESGFDLDKVRNLLDLCTDFANQEKNTKVKIKPRKGCPAQKLQSPLLSSEEDCKGFLSTRWLPKEPVEQDQASSPPLKARAQRWLSSLSHQADCQCPCCSEPSLGRVTARWAATQADLALQQGPTERRSSRKLHLATLARCKGVTTKLGTRLANLVPLVGATKAPCKPTLLQDLVGRVYLCMALSGLDLHQEKAQGTWKVLEAGQAFLASKPSPELGPLRAGLLGAKALASCLALAAQNHCPLEELFSPAWTWKPPKEAVEPDHKPQTLPPPVSTKKPKDPAIPSKTKDPKKAKDSVSKIKVSLSTTATKPKCVVPKTPVAVKPPRTKSSVGEHGSFNFDTVVPMVVCTPVQRLSAPASVRKGAVKPALKVPFMVYEEVSPVQDKPQPVPAAPKRTKKSRFKVEFSDESDPEADPHVEVKQKAEASKKRQASTRKACVLKAAPEPPVKAALPRRPARGKKSTVLPLSCTSSEEEGRGAVTPTRTARRGRSRRAPSGPEAGEEPENMRTIEEENEGTLNSSIEELRASDTETEENRLAGMAVDASDTEFEVLRKDRCGDKERDFLSELRNGGHPAGALPIHHPHLTIGPGDLSMEVIQSLLLTAWLALQHFPPPTLYPRLCALLALSMGQQDPVTTAMLHAQSLGVTSRHHMIRHLANRLKKLKKSSSELADQLSSLSLQEATPQTGASVEQRLAQLEDIYSFPAADSSAFPQHHCQKFTTQLQELPSGVTVCVLSVLEVQPGEIGDTLLLSRLEKGSAPVTVRIPTTQREHPVSWLVQEMDSVQKEQKAVSCVSDKAKWWQGRRGLDARVERLLEEMEGLLVCWRGLLLPLTSDPQLSTVTQKIHKSLTALGVEITKDMLKAVLSASPLLSQQDLRLLAHGVSPERGEECVLLLQAAVSSLTERAEPKGHVVLILDKYLQKLPWESISCLRPQSVTRMPSLHSLLGLCALKESDPGCVLNRGVDTKQVYYVLNPDANLGDTEERFKDWFSSEGQWQGVCGVRPNSEQLQEVVTTKDLYIYVGHGAGARYLDGQRILKQDLRAASLLFGCSSAALAVRGEQEGSGIILNYLMAGCPFVLGNLWDVTDRDIDRFTKALLESWLSAGSGAPLLDHMATSRQATHLKHLIGAAPIVYGLPIYLQ
ncbi:separin [Hypomesus transpacificus]|uniref:separin n=1 Tax=Hypomesus transpacificus TaxID=137520 RepID=UPI001F078E6F|nr:separin [Hypomesus transpacificus]